VDIGSGNQTIPSICRSRIKLPKEDQDNMNIGQVMEQRQGKVGQLDKGDEHRTKATSIIANRLKSHVVRLLSIAACFPALILCYTSILSGCTITMNH
jgi:hypothetical protein